MVLDALTYAGNLANVDDCAGTDGSGSFTGISGQGHGRRRDARGRHGRQLRGRIHVDRSILDPSSFIETNYNGVYVLLEAARRLEVKRFLQVSTDEVYGHVPEGSSVESDAFAPRSPYAASKAAAELLVQSYFTTYDMPVLVTRGGNTVGPCQYPEKVLPLFITNALEYKPLPVYGDGSAVRSYLYVGKTTVPPSTWCSGPANRGTRITWARTAKSTDGPGRPRPGKTRPAGGPARVRPGPERA